MVILSQSPSFPGTLLLVQNSFLVRRMDQAQIAFWSVVIALLGVVVGAGTTVGGAFLQARFERQHEDRRERRDEMNLLGALDAELAAILERYRDRLKPLIVARTPGQPFLMEWPVQHNYFVVFDATAGSLGLIKDQEVRVAIVNSYVRAKGLLDTLAMNTRLVVKLMDAIKEAGNDLSAPAVQLISAQAGQYADLMASGAAELEETARVALVLIKSDLQRGTDTTDK